MTFGIVGFAAIVMVMAFMCGIYLGHDHGFEQGRRLGHHEAYTMSKKWGDVGQ